MKKMLFLSALLLLLPSINACQKTSPYTKYEDSFYDTFDTLIQVVAYTKTEEEFQQYFDTIHNRYQELHKLFDTYNNYPDLVNVKTINDLAGGEPIRVQKEIIDLLVFSKEWHKKTKNTTNIAFGSVLKIWQEYRDQGKDFPDEAKLPPLEALTKANEHTDIEKVIVNQEDSTVFLEDEKMSLDVGAVAKGFATELIVEEIQEMGMTSGIINAGGNVHTIGKPLDNQRDYWGVGIQNPDISIFSDQLYVDVVYINDASIVSSGDYQRYYTVEGNRYHHIIDPKTLYPGDTFHAVTIISPSSTLADFLSTAVFLMPFEEGKELIESLPDTMALWIFKDETIRYTENMKDYLKSKGATGKKST